MIILIICYSFSPSDSMHITSVLLSFDLHCSLLPTLLILESKELHGCSLLSPEAISKLSLTLLSEASGKHVIPFSSWWVIVVDAHGLSVTAVETDAAEASTLLVVCEIVVSGDDVVLQLFKSLALAGLNSLPLAEFNMFK